jgi:hypothetical protein
MAAYGEFGLAAVTLHLDGAMGAQSRSRFVPVAYLSPATVMGPV